MDARAEGESDEMRKTRLNNFLEFLGPGGYATPDDIEALETCQVTTKSAADKSNGMKCPKVFRARAKKTGWTKGTCAPSGVNGTA